MLEDSACNGLYLRNDGQLCETAVSGIECYELKKDILKQRAGKRV